LSVISRLRHRARFLKRDAVTLYFAVRDPRTPLIAKLVVALVVAYALSPIDLIPDFIRVVGYLDEIILIPLGIALSLHLIPDEILTASRNSSRQTETLRRSRRYCSVVDTRRPRYSRCGFIAPCTVIDLHTGLSHAGVAAKRRIGRLIANNSKPVAMLATHLADLSFQKSDIHQKCAGQVAA
jgi:uncharacterized membrane protein YkvA (DUF1232 family)